MKTKYIIAIVLAAVVGLSFTVISSNTRKQGAHEVLQDFSAPIGGIATDDSF